MHPFYIILIPFVQRTRTSLMDPNIVITLKTIESIRFIKLVKSQVQKSHERLLTLVLVGAFVSLSIMGDICEFVEINN